MNNNLWFTNDSVQCEAEHDSAAVRMPQRSMCFLEGNLKKSQNTKLLSILDGYLQMDLKGERDGGNEHSDLYTSCRGNHM